MKATAQALARFWSITSSSELRRNIFETYGTRLLVLGTTFATAVVIARELGPSGRGLYAVAVTVGAIGVQFSNLGLHLSNTYYVAKNRTLLPTLIGNTLAVVFVVFIVTALVGAGLSLWPKLAPLHGMLFALALASVPISLAYLLMQSLLLGVNEVRAYNKIESSGKILTLMLICVPIVFDIGTAELFFGITLCLSTLTLVWAFVQLNRVSVGPPAFSLVVLRQSIGTGINAYMILFFGFLVLRIDLLMVKYMLGASEAGYYSVSQVLAENTMMFPVVLGQLLFPKLTAIKDTEEKLRLANKAVMATAALMFPTVVIAALAAGPVISITFGRNFFPAVAPFVWLMPGTYFLAIETVMVQLLNSEGFPTILVMAWTTDAIINIGLNFWAIPHYGIRGASIVSSFCYFLMFLIVCVIMRNYSRSPVVMCSPQPRAT